VDYSRSEIEEWRMQTLAKATRLRYAIEHNEFIMKDISCHYQFGKPCEFREVCRKPPEVRDFIISTDYETMVPWDPGKPERRNK